MKFNDKMTGNVIETENEFILEELRGQPDRYKPITPKSKPEEKPEDK